MHKENRFGLYDIPPKDYSQGSYMRIWARQFKDTHMLCQELVIDESKDTRTHKVFKALETVSQNMDLAQPIWLDKNIKAFKKNAVVKFGQDSFIEEVPFDYLEFRVIEED